MVSKQEQERLHHAGGWAESWGGKAEGKKQECSFHLTACSVEHPKFPRGFCASRVSKSSSISGPGVSTRVSGTKLT